MPYLWILYWSTMLLNRKVGERRTIREVVDADEEALTVDDRDVVDGAEAEDDDEGEVINLAQRCLELLGQSMSKAHIEG